MAKILGINAVFHDPAAALVVGGRIVAAAEEERFSRRKHGKRPVPFSTWELPELSAKWCLEFAGVRVEDLDAIAYSYDPWMMEDPQADPTDDGWEGLRTLYARRAPKFLKTIFPGLDPEKVRFVQHHVAHAASCCMAAPFPSSAVMVLDGRGERTSALLGHYHDGKLDVLWTQPLPHSLGLTYEEATQHLGFERSADEYKVMALASYGSPRFLPQLRERIQVREGFHVQPIRWHEMAPQRLPDEPWGEVHADLASSVQHRLEEVMVELARMLHERTGERVLTMAGGVALNCVANSRVFREGPFDHVWVQPAAGDSGTALGAALSMARQMGDALEPMHSAALGRGFTAGEIEEALRTADVPFERPDDLGDAVAEVIASDGVVAWFQGRAEFGPRALGNRSLLANPSNADIQRRLNDIKGREQFRPVAPMVLAERAQDVFEGGPFPSPYMLFTHRTRPEWRDRIPAVVHVDGSARIQTVDAADDPLLHHMLSCVEVRTGVPVIVNTSLNTAGRPMVDTPRDALELFGSAPVAALAIGPFLVRRSKFAR